MKYARPPFPPALWTRFNKVAHQLGYSVRGHKWRLLEFLIDYAEMHGNLFRSRGAKLDRLLVVNSTETQLRAFLNAFVGQTTKKWNQKDNTYTFSFDGQLTMTDELNTNLTELLSTEDTSSTRTIS